MLLAMQMLYFWMKDGKTRLAAQAGHMNKEVPDRLDCKEPKRCLDIDLGHSAQPLSLPDALRSFVKESRLDL